MDQPRELQAPAVLPVQTDDGATFEVICVLPDGEWRELLLWLPAMGVSARQYLPMADALATRGIAVVLYEWRGIGSSDQRAGRHGNWRYAELLTKDLPAACVAIGARWPHARVWTGGHSLGGQLTVLHASLQATPPAGILLVTSGAPYWRCFRYGWLVGLAYVLAPWLARVVGHLPGRRIGFGGNEARGVIDDWARSGRTGRYAAAGLDQDLEDAMASLAVPLLAVRLADDWLGPEASLEWLLAKLPHAQVSRQTLVRDDFGGAAADHFTWMKQSQPVAARMAAWIAAQASLRDRAATPAA